MIKKIALSTLLISSLAYAIEEKQTIDPQLLADIEAAKAQKDEAEKKLATLEAQLPKDTNKLITHTELGYIQTQGNTQTKTFNLDANIKKTFNDTHVFEWSFDGQSATDNDVESKNKFFTELTYDYKFTPSIAFTYLAGYKRDKFSSYDSQFYTGPGAKYTAVTTDKHNLDLEGNVLYSHDEIMEVRSDSAGNIVDYPYTGVDTIIATSGYIDDYASVRAKAVYTWQIFENLKFDQELTYRVDAEDVDNYFGYSKTALSSKFSDILSGVVSYKIDYVNQSGDKERTDTTFTLGLIIDY